MAKTKDKVSDAASNAKPYLDRALHDEELRENVRNAYASARNIYDELVGRRGVSGVATRVATDKDIQDELRSTIAELRKAADRVQGKQQHKSSGGFLLFVGIVLAALFNPVTGPRRASCSPTACSAAATTSRTTAAAATAQPAS